jgi:hypothetical protein
VTKVNQPVTESSRHGSARFATSKGVRRKRAGSGGQYDSGKEMAPARGTLGPFQSRGLSPGAAGTIPELAISATVPRFEWRVSKITHSHGHSANFLSVTSGTGQQLYAAVQIIEHGLQGNRIPGRADLQPKRVEMDCRDGGQGAEGWKRP